MVFGTSLAVMMMRIDLPAIPFLASVAAGSRDATDEPAGGVFLPWQGLADPAAAGEPPATQEPGILSGSAPLATAAVPTTGQAPAPPEIPAVAKARAAPPGQPEQGGLAEPGASGGEDTAAAVVPSGPQAAGRPDNPAAPGPNDGARGTHASARGRAAETVLLADTAGAARSPEYPAPPPGLPTVPATPGSGQAGSGPEPGVAPGNPQAMPTLDPAPQDLAVPNPVGSQPPDAPRPAAATGPPLAAPPAPPTPARQIAETIITAQDDRVEIRLDPPELGRVVITLLRDGEVMRVHLAADRPETLDLLRRNTPELAQELRLAGQDTAAFSFGRPSGGQPQPAAWPMDPQPTPPTTGGPGQTGPARLTGHPGQLDIRL